MARPSVVADFYSDRQLVLAGAMRAADRVWGRIPPADPAGWFGDHVEDLVGVTTAAQHRAAAPAGEYVETALSQQGVALEAEARPNPAALAGVASDGRGLDSLMFGTVIHYEDALAKTDGGAAARVWAWDKGRDALMLRVKTQVSDASRVATGLAVFSRRGCLYERMLVGKSCGRCVVLAGRLYRTPAFERHPGCDCQMVPTGEGAPSWATDPMDYFDSLDADEQDRTFTKAGAQAIRDGADPSQVVNARRGMDTAAGKLVSREMFGREIYATSEGITRRGWANREMRANHGAMSEVKRGRYRQAVPPRLMPESIYEHATDRADALRLLKIYGYVV